jgi:hypothetical protein
MIPHDATLVISALVEAGGECNLYIPPTPTEIRALLRAWGLTGKACGDLADVNPRTVRKWTGGERTMPYTALYTIANRKAGMRPKPNCWRLDLASFLP